MSEASQRSRFIPKLESLKAAARLLPDAGLCAMDEYQVHLKDGQTVAFRRLKMRMGTASRFHWVYDGKVRVD